MRNTGIFVILLVGIVVLWGCGPTAEVVKPGGPTIKQAMSEPAQGKKMRLAVMQFDNQTGYDVGNGMRAMLTSTLFRTDRFILVEREMLGDVLLEQQLATAGVVRPETAAPTGEVEGAQLLIYGTITDFEPGQRGVRTVAGGAQQSHVAIDLKILDSRTSRVVAATIVEGKATDIYLDTSALKYVGMSPLLALDAWNNTPMGSAIRLCIDKAVDYIVLHIE